MLLKNIYDSSNYVTDEEMTSSQVVAMANACLAEINTKANTNLPFFNENNYQGEEYIAFGDSWQMRLIEPYLSYGIASNDADVNARDFHYNRFLVALSEFKSYGIGTILTETTDEDGNIIETGYAGNSKRVVPINAQARANPFKGWW